MIDAGRRHFLKTAAAGLVLTGVAGCRSTAPTAGARMKPGPSDVLIVVDGRTASCPAARCP